MTMSVGHVGVGNARVRTDPKTEPMPPNTNDAVRDQALEADLLNLMLTLEQFVAALSEERKRHKRPLGAMKLTRDLIERVFLFADGRLDPGAQAVAFERTQAVYNTSIILSVRLERLSRKELEAFYQEPVPEPSPVFHDYRQTGRALEAALGEYFHLFALGFRSPEKASQWDSTFRVFLDDLISKW